MKQFEVDGWYRVTEEDSFEEGCLPETASHNSGNERFVGETQNELIDKLMEFVGAKEDETVLVNSCDDRGRIDICVMEDADGSTATEREIERWKNGEIKLYYSTYTFQVEFVKRETAILLPTKDGRKFETN